MLISVWGTNYNLSNSPSGDCEIIVNDGVVDSKIVECRIVDSKIVECRIAECKIVECRIV